MSAPERTFESLRTIITSDDPAVRDTPLDAWARGRTAEELLAECAALDQFRRQFFKA